MSADLPRGLRVAHFRIESLLGEGGMGAVYRAWDTKLERPVALKILPPDLVADRSRLGRFEREAKSASALAHPHIVTIYEIGHDDVVTGDDGSETSSLHYIAMELIDGATLRTLIHEERTDLRTLLRYLSQAAEGVARAHDANVVHRDLKPDNIMVTREGYAKVLDFGLAKLDAQADPDGDLTSAPTVREDATQEGAVVGTVGYMSPEQVRGVAVDHRTDVFSFGCLLYEAATRRRPFTASSRVETMHRILRDEPAAMEEINPEVPGALRRLVKRCLAKDPERRFQSMRDLALGLADLVDDYDSLSPVSSSGVSSTVVEPPAPVERRSGSRFWIAGLIAVGLVAALAWVLLGRSSGNDPPRTGPSPDAPTLKMRELTTTSDVAHVAISGDGSYMAVARWRPEGTGLWITHLATGSSVEVVAPEGNLNLRGVAFTPDDNYLVFVRNDPERAQYSSVFQVPVLGGEPRRLLWDIDSVPSFSPDGRKMTFLRGAPHLETSYLMVADADGGNAEILAEAADPEPFEYTEVAWSPEGSTIVAIRDRADGLSEALAAVDAASGEMREIELAGRTFADLDSLAWLPDGSGLLFTGREGLERQHLWLADYPGGEARPLTSDLSEYDDVTITADGRRLVSRHQSSTSRAWIAPAANPDDLRPLTSNPRDLIGKVAVASDGTVFFDRTDPAGSHIFRLSPGGQEMRLTQSDRWSGPQISDDGSILVARRQTGIGGPVELWRLDSETGDRVSRLFEHAERVWAFDLAPDGSWVAAQYAQGEIAIQPIDGGEARSLIEKSDGGPWISPDGSRLAYRVFETADDGTASPFLKLVTLDGVELAEIPEPRIADNDGWYTGFSPSGDGLTAHQWVSGVANLWHLPFDGSPMRQLTDREPDITAFIRDADWTPDGEWLVLSLGNFWSDAVLIEGFR